MFTESNMSSTQKLSIIHPDTIECFMKPSPPSLFNTRINETYNSDYISSETWDEYSSADIFEELSPKEDEIAYYVYVQDFQSANLEKYPKLYIHLPPVPPANEEKIDDEEDLKEQSTYNDVYYSDSMDMEAAMREDAKRINKFKK